MQDKRRRLINRLILAGYLGVGSGALLLALIPWYASHLQDTSLRQAELGYKVESLHTAESAVFYNPLSVNALFVLAGAQQRLGREAEARSTLVKATQIQPRNYTTWEQLALYERDRWHEPEKAVEDFQKAVSLNPADSHLRAEAGLP